MSAFLLDSVLELGISLQGIRDHNRSDLEKVVHFYGIYQIAKSDFMNGKITFDEYLQLCESLGISPDEQAASIEHNLLELKLI